MGKLRKIGKKIWKGIKKVGKKVGKVFGKILKPFGKLFSKLGPIGTMAMTMFLPGIGQLIAGWGSTLGGVVGNAIQFVGNAVNYVASAPQKIFSTITNAVSTGFDVLTVKPLSGGKSWMQNFSDKFAKDFGTFDVSAAGQQRILNLTGEERVGNLLGYDDSVQYALDTGKLDDFAGSASGTLPEGKTLAETMRDQETTATVPDSATTATTPPPESTTTPPPPEPDGALAKTRARLKNLTEGIMDTKITGVGTVGDVTWAGSTGLNAYNLYGEMTAEEMSEFYNANLSDAEMMVQATNMGAMDARVPVWNFDSNLTASGNLNASRQAWNNFYGLDSMIDPMQMNGYGFNYETWLQQSLGRV